MADKSSGWLVTRERLPAVHSLGAQSTWRFMLASVGDCEPSLLARRTAWIRKNELLAGIPFAFEYLPRSEAPTSVLGGPTCAVAKAGVKSEAW